MQRFASQRGRAILLAILLVVLLILAGPLLVSAGPIEVPAFQGLPTAHIALTPAETHDWYLILYQREPQMFTIVNICGIFRGSLFTIVNICGLFCGYFACNSRHLWYTPWSTYVQQYIEQAICLQM